MARDGRYHDDVPVPLGHVRALIAHSEAQIRIQQVTFVSITIIKRV